jgi:hypothetical protein
MGKVQVSFYRGDKIGIKITADTPAEVAKKSTEDNNPAIVESAC